MFIISYIYSHIIHSWCSRHRAQQQLAAVRSLTYLLLAAAYLSLTTDWLTEQETTAGMKILKICFINRRWSETFVKNQRGIWDRCVVIWIKFEYIFRHIFSRIMHIPSFLRCLHLFLCLLFLLALGAHSASPQQVQSTQNDLIQLIKILFFLN